MGKGTDEKFCSECGSIIKLDAGICPECRTHQAIRQPVRCIPGSSAETGLLRFLRTCRNWTLAVGGAFCVLGLLVESSNPGNPHPVLRPAAMFALMAVLIGGTYRILVAALQFARVLHSPTPPDWTDRVTAHHLAAACVLTVIAGIATSPSPRVEPRQAAPQSMVARTRSADEPVQHRTAEVSPPAVEQPVVEAQTRPEAQAVSRAVHGAIRPDPTGTWLTVTNVLGTKLYADDGSIVQLAGCLAVEESRATTAREALWALVGGKSIWVDGTIEPGKTREAEPLFEDGISVVDAALDRECVRLAGQPTVKRNPAPAPPPAPRLIRYPEPPASTMVLDLKNHLKRVSGGVPTLHAATARPFRWLLETDFKDATNSRRLSELWQASKNGTLDFPGLAKQRAAYAEYDRAMLRVEQARRDAENSFMGRLTRAFSSEPDRQTPPGVRRLTTDQGPGYVATTPAEPTFRSPSIWFRNSAENDLMWAQVRADTSYRSPAPASTSSYVAPNDPRTQWTPPAPSKPVHVDGYTKEDGTHVEEHWRASPDR